MKTRRHPTSARLRPAEAGLAAVAADVEGMGHTTWSQQALERAGLTIDEVVTLTASGLTADELRALTSSGALSPQATPPTAALATPRANSRALPTPSEQREIARLVAEYGDLRSRHRA